MKLKRFMVKDRVCAIVALLFAAAVFITAASFPKSILDALGSSIYPQVLAAGIAVCAVLLFITAKPNKEELARWAEEDAAAAEGREPVPAPRGDALGVMITIALLIIYYLLFITLGFFVATIAFCMGFAIKFDPRPMKERIIRGLIFSVPFTVIIYLLFAKVLNVLLPTLIL